MTLAPGIILAGKYRLERPLAVGGMGSIWVARHLHLEVQVAMKFMEAGHEASAAGRARFEREARAAAALRNQHVVQVLDYGVEAGVPYLVMELLAGEDLSERLHRERRLPLGEASKIVSQAARGLRTAHEAGVVHRDLKPANVFIARIDDEEVVKILDFGIAKETSLGGLLGEGTKTGELMGSPHYMSPEQVRGARDIDPRSDLWSLAVILFRAITGSLPFAGEVVGAVIAQILADPIPVATAFAPDLPPAVDAFFARGFARDRAARFQTARELAEAFAVIAQTPSDMSGSWQAVPAGAFLRDQTPTRLHPSSAGAAYFTPPSISDPAFPAPVVGDARERAPTHSGSIAASSLGGSTGSPVTHTAHPVGRTPPAWWGAATGGGAIIGVIVGAGLFALTNPSPSPGPPEPVTAASGDPSPSAAPSAMEEPAAPSTTTTATPTPAPVKADPPASASVKPAAPPRPAPKPSPKTPAPKKKP